MADPSQVANKALTRIRMQLDVGERMLAHYHCDGDRIGWLTTLGLGRRMQCVEMRQARAQGESREAADDEQPLVEAFEDSNEVEALE